MVQPINPAATNPAGGTNFSAQPNFNPAQQTALAGGLRPENWNQQQEQGVGVWNSYTPEQQTQFMQGMTDYYQTGAGQGTFQEDQQASTEYWSDFPSTGEPPVEEVIEVEDDIVDTTGGNGRQNNDGTYTRPTNPWSPPPPQQPQTVYPNRPQDYNSMSDWQKWQVDNRPMGATSELERPDDVALGGQQQDLDYNDPYTVSAQQGQQPLGSLYHPWQSYEGVQGAGGNYGGAGGQQYQQGYNPAIPQYYDQINNQYRQDLGRNVDNQGHRFYDNEFQMGMDQNRLSDILRDSDEWRGNQPQAPNPRTYDTPEFNQAITGMLQNFGIDENNYESFTPLLQEYYGSTGNPSQQGFAEFIMSQGGGDANNGTGGTYNYTGGQR